MFRRLSPVVLVLALLVSSRAHSQTLYAVTSTGQLLTVDTSTGAASLRATISPAMQPTGLGFRGSELYVADFATSLIRKINPTTGAEIVPGVNIGISFGTVFGVDEGDITFGSDGTGFMSRGFGRFERFDVVAGTSVQVTAPGQVMVDGLAFDSRKVLYGFHNILSPPTRLYTIDTTTGDFKAGPLTTGIPSGDNMGGAAFHPTTGILYAATSDLVASTLFRVDTVTGAATPIGSMGSIGVPGVTGLSFSPPPVPPPPPQPPVTWTPSPPPEGNFGTGAGGGEGGFGRLVRQGSTVVNVSARVQAAEVTEPATSGSALVSILAAGFVVVALLVIGGGVFRKTLAG